MTRYHDIKESIGEVLRSAERGVDRLLVGRRQPTPKNIVDLGKTVSQAQTVQLVLDGMQSYRPSPMMIEDDNEGYDSEGNWHHPSLRTEHVDGTL